MCAAASQAASGNTRLELRVPRSQLLPKRRRSASRWPARPMARRRSRCRLLELAGAITYQNLRPSDDLRLDGDGYWMGTVVLQASQAAAGNYTAGTQTRASLSRPKRRRSRYGAEPDLRCCAVHGDASSTHRARSPIQSFPDRNHLRPTVTITGVGTVVLQASQAASGNYTAGTQNATFTVASEAQTSPSRPRVTVTYGVSRSTLSATASSGLTVTFNVVSVQRPLGQHADDHRTRHRGGSGEPTRNDEYGAAPQVTQSIVSTRPVHHRSSVHRTLNAGKPAIHRHCEQREQQPS